MASSETPPPSLRQGEALLAAGEQVGHGNLVFASRVNKAVLVLVKSEQMVHQLVASGVIIRDLYVQVSPLSVPSTRVTVSGVPPFIPNELLEVELRRFGKFASGFKTPPAANVAPAPAPEPPAANVAPAPAPEPPAANVAPAAGR
ncbi:hypothetical protein NHX12_032055 [Muraenolepis orangiensis]|uniref:Uncharacterized protein n=1 Tax=Muraenolepis orangiensis TaxID=630683 RepID=A0A9Q0EAT1_9TELE|nr:hypothetical protein NHX12_032055 [Muraenolepis orangiensis]